MKIGIIIKSGNINSYENAEFRRVALTMGINMQFLIHDKLSVLFNQKTVIYYEDKILNDIDVVIPRTGSATDSRLATIIDAFTYAGVYVLNSGESIRTLMDKFRVHGILTKNNINTINSIHILDNKNLSIVNQNFKFPVVVKSNTGSFGWGIYKCDSYKNLTQLMDMAYITDRNSYNIIQEFVDFKSGEDIRVIAMKGKVLGAMKRHAPEGEFITNYSLHHNSSKYEVTDELKDLCLKILDVLDVEIAGIDFLETANGYCVCEVNSAPGFKGMQNANPNINIPKEIYKMLKKTS